MSYETVGDQVYLYAQRPDVVVVEVGGADPRPSLHGGSKAIAARPFQAHDIVGAFCGRLMDADDIAHEEQQLEEHIIKEKYRFHLPKVGDKVVMTYQL